MSDIPFSTFTGHLKQHAHGRLDPLEQEFFTLLFPAFEGVPGNPEHPMEDLLQAFKPILGVVPGESRSRRFSGYGLPRSRYYTLATDDSGEDGQTLAHELRAYRDPTDIGMIEVIDLARGCHLMIDDSAVELEPEHAIAVLIHEPQRIPQRFLGLKFQRIAGVNGRPLFLLRYPYGVHSMEMDKVVDLRLPEVRDWFHRTFCDLPDQSTWAQEGMPPTEPTTALSRFEFVVGRAPKPPDFWAMLPTLMNPDLGGGSPADAGSTLFMIGNWLRAHGVGALIFPSARCDTSVEFEDGVLSSWQGWNLVDYREAPLLDVDDASASTFVKSPWAWVRLPHSVCKMVAGPDSPYAGSFAVVNMVEYWADDYLRLVRALEIARSKHGREPSREAMLAKPEDLAPRMFLIGTLSMGWLRMLLRGPGEGRDELVLELHGLAHPLGLHVVSGRVWELWTEPQSALGSYGDALLGSLHVGDLLVGILARHHRGMGFDALARIGCFLELAMLLLEAAGNHSLGGSTPNWLGYDAEIESAVDSAPLTESLKARLDVYFRMSWASLEAGSTDVRDVIEEGGRLQRDLLEFLH